MKALEKKIFMKARRKARVRGKINGTAERPRLSVFRSNKNIYAQLIDDIRGCTLASASSRDKAVSGEVRFGGNKEAALKVGAALAARAIEAGVTKVVFDRAGYKFHGRVKELAEAARKGGLQF